MPEETVEERLERLEGGKVDPFLDGSVRRIEGDVFGPHRVTNETASMNRKNRPANASGWRKKVRMPNCTQSKPVRAGTW